MATTSIRIGSALSVHTRAGALGNKRWMDLLASVGETNSINAAAKVVGLTYKAAWDAIDAMNNLSDRPLVERSVGGKGGGGTRLTANGRRLVRTFRMVEDENTRFLDALNTRVRNADRDLGILGRLTMLTSARNQFAGQVSRIKKGSVNDEIQIKLTGGEKLVAIVTHDSVDNLGLAVGKAVVALIKASSVIVAIDTDAPLQLSARNQLAGTIGRLIKGAVNTEVVIELKGGNSVAAVITNAAAKALKLRKGKPASAIFKASSVIVGVTS
ncbi:MAG TPA: TOBE domain-containing protein [Pseudomonadales bacterium]